MRKFFFLLLVLSGIFPAYSIDTHWNLEPVVIKNGVSDNTIYNVCYGSDGFIWLSTDKGISRYDGFRFRDYPLIMGIDSLSTPLHQAVKKLCEGPDGLYYALLFQGGITCFDKDIEKFLPVRFDKPLELKDILDFCWNDGSLYLVTSQGLFESRIVRKTEGKHDFVLCLLNPEPVVRGKVAHLCSDGKTNLYFSVNQRKVVHYDLVAKKTSLIKEYSVVNRLFLRHGYLWICRLWDDIICYDLKTNEERVISMEGKDQSEFSNSYVTDLVLKDNRTFYLTTWNGLYKLRFDNDNLCKSPFVLTLLTKNEKAFHSSIENKMTSLFWDDKQQILWVGTFGGGVLVYSPDFKMIKHFYTAEQFPSNTINSIYGDSKKRIWVATGEGLVCFPSPNNMKYQVFKRGDGLENAHIRAIMEDASGRIWCSTNKGISCYIAVKNSFYNYGRWDGVPIVGFMSGSVTHDYDGNIYFGSLNGLCRFNPEMVLAKREAPSAIMTGLRIFVPISERKSEEKMIELHGCPAVRLSYMQNNFSVTFNIQNYALADQVEYAYMLKGLENSWYTVTDPNNVTFRNIPPGNYCFQVKTRIRNQEWADEIASLDIRIDPPVWLTWWAKLFYILSGVSVLYFILHAYKKKLDMESLYELEKKNHEQEQELNNERLRFYTNITHELRTPLTLILGPLEDMQKSNSLSGKDSQKISVIHQSAIRLLNLINQILEFRKTETQNKKLCVSRDNLAALVHEIGLKYKELNRKPEIDFCLEIEQEDMSLFFDKEVVTIILDNLISNAIKYTEKGTITLGLHQVVRNNIHHTEISVSDTGFGIAPDALPHIFDRYYQEGSEHQASGTGIGLALVKNLVVLHEGEIRVESSLNVGSTFYVSLLTDNTYPHVLHADSTEKTSDEKDEKEENIEPVHSGKRILLIVEDNRDICDYIVESFSDDFEVRTAANGEQGLEQALGCIPDIIVSDIMMPVMNGIVMCRKLKEDLRTSHIPIILLTAKDSLQDKEEGYQVGADSYLTKPFSATLLHSRIHNLLESRKLLAERFNTNSILIDKRAAVTESMNKLDNEFLEKINKLIEDRLSSEKIDIGYLSDAMCMSNSTLYRKMKALTGLSTNEYIRKIKMQYAERLLLEGKYNISEVAFKVGINSTVYFRQCFKDEFGMAPSDYLKKIKPE